jgi:Methyltransferase FkbM domain
MAKVDWVWQDATLDPGTIIAKAASSEQGFEVVEVRPARRMAAFTSLKQRTKEVLLPEPGPYAVPFGIARGVRMNVDFAFQTRTFFGLYEIELNKFLRDVLRPGVKAFDVGGQYGYDALVIAKRTQAPVATFECDAHCMELMKGNFALNPELAPVIRPVEATVGDAVDQLGLDDWIATDGFIPDFIKVDIDGGELGALRSAEHLLATRRPSVLVETHSPALERACGELLVSHGYRPVIVNQRGIWPDLRPLAHNRWLIAR